VTLIDLITFGRSSRRLHPAVDAKAEQEFQRLHHVAGLVLQVSAAGSLASFAVVTAANSDIGNYGKLLALVGACLAIPALYSLLALSLVTLESDTSLANKRTLVGFASLSLFFVLEVGLATGSAIWFVASF
jgi:hypothetical protein